MSSRIVSGLTQPLCVTHAPGDPNRLFVLERTGRVKIVNLTTRTVNTTPFLDLSASVATAWLEYGLLGITFHPDYQHNGYFYVNYTPTAASVADTMVARYHVSANPDIADPTSATTILRFGFGTRLQHRAGWMDFGPDGYLYISTGDGAESDPDNAAQNLTLLRGKILRLDVNGPDGVPGTGDDDGFPADTLKNYRIPPTNPFAGSATNAQEIWAFGLRNPWRCSFDRETGDLWIGDVGQNTREEVDIAPFGAPGGKNFGWRCTEGTFCTSLTGCTCNGVGLSPPVYEYPHTTGLSVTGGYVYRGCAMPDLRGTYIFADYQNTKFFSFRYDGTTVSGFVDRTTQVAATGTPSAFGEDLAGELYYCEYSSGNLQKIVPRNTPPAPLTITQQPLGAQVCTGDTAPFVVGVTSVGSAAAVQWQIQTAPNTWATLGNDPMPLACGGFALALPPFGLSTNIRVNPCPGVSDYPIRALATNACAAVPSNAVTLHVDPCPTCNADLNQDGNVDQEDVRVNIDVIAGGDNPWGIDADFNRDGNVDQDDIAAIVDVVAGGPCP